MHTIDSVDALDLAIIRTRGIEMAHASSLRVIGQLLEVARLADFKLEHDKNYYIVRSDSLTQTTEWILRNALNENGFSQESDRRSTSERSVRFTRADISRLDVQEQKKRKHSSASTAASSRLSQLLRTLGDHLDKTAVSAFNISWTLKSVSVDYQGPDGQSDCRTFSAEKLQQLGFHTTFGRSRQTRVDSNSPDLTRYVPATENLKHTRHRHR